MPLVFRNTFTGLDSLTLEVRYNLRQHFGSTWGGVAVGFCTPRRILLLDNGFGDITSVEIYYFSYLNLPSPNVAGFNFVGWYSNGIRYRNGMLWSYSLEEEWRLTAVWTLRNSIIRYILPNGGVHSNTRTHMTIEDSPYVLSDAYLFGHTFAGWFDGSTGGNQIIELRNVSQDIWLFARFIPVQVRVSFDTDNTAPIYVNFGQAFTAPVPTRANYRFDGWFHDGVRITTPGGASFVPSMFAENVTLQARWI